MGEPGYPEWVWVITQNDKGEETFLALDDEENNVSFIPVFRTKEDAVVGESAFNRRPGVLYGVEAIRLAVLAQQARENKFDIYVIDHTGKVLERLAPMPDA